MKRILGAGGAGYIGPHVCKALSQQGFSPITFDSLVAGHREAVRWGPLIECDLGDRARLEAVLRDEKIEAVMHFAAYLQVGESIENAALYYTKNVVKTLGLLDAMVAFGVGTLVVKSEEHTSELQSLLRISYAVFCLEKHTSELNQHKRRP